MALSNILVEPRREITETVVGLSISLLIVGLWAWGTYWIGTSYYQCAPFMKTICWTVAFFTIPAIIVGNILAILIFIGLLKIIHAIGDLGCDLLEDLNIQLRPKERYRRDYRGEIVRSN